MPTYGTLTVQMVVYTGNANERSRQKLVTLLRLHGVTQEEAAAAFAEFKTRNPALIGADGGAYWQPDSVSMGVL